MVLLDGSPVVPLTGSLAHALCPHLGSENPLRHPLSKAYPVPLPQAGAVLDSAPFHCPSWYPKNEHKWPTPLFLGSGQTTGNLLFWRKEYTPSSRIGLGIARLVRCLRSQQWGGSGERGPGSSGVGAAGCALSRGEANREMTEGAAGRQSDCLPGSGDRSHWTWAWWACGKWQGTVGHGLGETKCRLRTKPTEPRDHVDSRRCDPSIQP